MKEKIKIYKQIKIISVDNPMEFGMSLIDSSNAKLNNIIEHFERNFTIIKVYNTEIKIAQYEK